MGSLDLNLFKDEAEKYAQSVVKGDELASKYVRLECEKFLDRLKHSRDGTFDYNFDYKTVSKINNILSKLIFPTGFKAGQSIITGLAPFQFFILHNIFCWKHKETNDNLINEVYLEIARKNGKTFLCALIMIISLIISDRFSQCYSGAKTRELARLIFKEITDTLKVSPQIDKYFKRTGTYIRCVKTDSEFSVVSSEANNTNGKRPQIFVLDEVAVQTDFGLWDALKYGQLSVNNPLSISISTAYTVDDNIFKKQCEYLKNVLDGIIKNDHVFGMLFELDEEDLKHWNNFELWYKASPIQCSFEKGKEKLIEEYEKAILFGGSKVAEFQSKMLNMWVDDAGASSFVSYDDLKVCRINNYNWSNREVYCGVDLSISTDNTSVAFVTYDEQLKKYVTMAMTFIPEDRRIEKENLEKVPYGRYEQQGYCISCKGRAVNKTIDYSLVEQYVADTVSKYNLKVKAIVTDPYHAEETMQRLEDKGFNIIQQLQKSTQLGKGTEKLQNAILDHEFAYEFNPLIDINFRNAKSNRDYQGNLYIDKKKSSGRIDIIDSIINCFCMIANDELIKTNIYETDKRDGFLIF